MAKGVVDLFKTIEVKVKTSERSARSTASSKSAIEPVEQLPAIWQAPKWVDARHIREASLNSFYVRDIGHHRVKTERPTLRSDIRRVLMLKMPNVAINLISALYTYSLTRQRPADIVF